ncbi:protein cordon-bleu isoform X3 [Parambassis ranga]|uniref:Protein cordon-bleu isoform X3 n=1 Tax=Parambassis ranga TaxID=210632 RepID=A0A6P7JVD4_9TELE|nr:protein cordon-bleu isoform X3 [Parambassis ranga]
MTESSKPPLGRKMKPRAPPPPQAPQPAPRHIFRNTVPDGGGTSNMDAKENILRPTVDLQLTLPQGCQVSVTEDGSKALMDLLVELCCRHHLNPSLHTLELFSPEGQPMGFKPNALLGSLNVACVVIKEKVWEEKVVRRPAPKVPEKTVRLMVNYHGSQKAVVRVNPLVPLQALIPVICDKCEFDPAHILLLKDSVSRHEWPLDKSLTELGIKELYIHDPSLDYIHSSTSSLGRPGKKGLLGIFNFSRRKSKTETSMDMDDCDDKIFQNTDTQSDGLSSVSGVPSIEDRPSNLGQSQSAMNIPRLSPKADTKKRRAPAPPSAPTPSMGLTSFDSYQMGLGSESQQRKRKAPAPPPTPTSITQASNDTSTSPAPTPDSVVIETPTPAFRTKVSQSTTTSATTVVITTVQQPSFKKAERPPPPVCDASPTPSSPTPSSSTTGSLVVQDTSSELSQSLDDSDADLDQAGSYYSSTVSGSAKVQLNKKSSSSRIEESASSTASQSNLGSSSRSDTESALNLKLDEVENNRKSAIGNTDRPVPPKPRRSPARELSQHDLLPTPSAPSSSPPIEPTESNPPESPMEFEETAPQSWHNSPQSCPTNLQRLETEAPEDETLSLGSSSGNSSLPDQGYAASEGMAEGEDSGMVSSLSDTQPTSPDGSLSLDGTRGGRVEKLGPVRDSSSDSDEGCATWRSVDRHSDTPEDTKLKNGYEDDQELTAQLNQTLADFEANLAGHIDIVSAKDTPYTMSTDSNEVPVSVVDMDVPVTAIDEVLVDYEREAMPLIKTKSAISKGPGYSHKSNTEPQNKNNNAYTAAVSDNRSSANAKQLFQSEQHSKPAKSMGDAKERKIQETKVKETNADVKETKQSSAVKSVVDMQKKSKNTELISDLVTSKPLSIQQKKPDLPPTTQWPGSTERDEDVHRVYQKSSSALHGKITPVTSRFGMKTFTVIPPKPSATHAATSQSGVSLTTGAIKIDDQGNMVTTGITRSKVGGSLQAERSSKESSPLLGKAKAFWSSNERQESPVFQSKASNERAKEYPNGLKNAPTAIVETSLKTSNTESLKTTQSTLSKPAEKVQSQEVVKDEVKEPDGNVRVTNKEQIEAESKISVSKTVQQSSDKPVRLPPQPPELKRDLFFLKPSRRTSSQYVASAINKYAPRTSAKPSYIPTNPDYSLKTQTTGFQRSGHSIQVNPHQSSQSSLSDNKEKVSSASNPPGPKRSISHPEYMSDSLRNSGEMLETETDMNNHLQSNGATHIKVTISNDRDGIKPVCPRSPSPVNALHSSTKPPKAPKTVSQFQASNSKDMTKMATHPTPAAKPQSSVTVSDGVTTGPPAVTVFGPIQKFRPVIHRSVDKETSLHSSLMEAIQTGGGKERLKKTSSSGPSNLKKVPYAEEENERSALLAAIRAQSTSSTLKKTTSEAAKELEKFRKTSSEEEKSTVSSPSPPSLTCTSPVFAPPTPPPAPMFAPPPPPPMFAPPPPPPVLPQGKPSSAAHPNANPPMNAAMAREAMLEAIRSGSAAERLKKVAAPSKTVQVNGRLGTIQASSSTVPQQ